MAEVDLTKIHALVVEDDVSGLAIIGLMLRHMGVSALMNSTGDGVAELACAMRPRPDVIFIDLNLPKTTGYELLKKIRAEVLLKGVLVIALTVQDADTEIPKCRAAGFDGFIGKPLSRSRFPRQVQRLLSGEGVWETY